MNKIPTTLDRRDRNISVDLEPGIKAQLIELAERSGLKLTEYLRTILNETARSQLKLEFTIQAEGSLSPLFAPMVAHHSNTKPLISNPVTKPATQQRRRNIVPAKPI